MARSSLRDGPPSPAYAYRKAAVLEISGDERVAFLQGQLTQDVRTLQPGASRLAAGLTPQGKLLYFGRLAALTDRLLLVLPPDAAPAAISALSRYAVFQKVAVRDVSAERVLASLYGRPAADVTLPDGGVRLSAWGELDAEILAPESGRRALEEILAAAGFAEIRPEDAEVRRVEAGRPEFGKEAVTGSLPQEAGLDAAIAPDKGCYVGQEVVARLRTYARVNRRLAGLRFPEETVPAGTVFLNPGKSSQEWARVTSSVVSPRFGPIGLGLVHREVADGAILRDPADLRRAAVVGPLPFS